MTCASAAFFFYLQHLQLKEEKKKKLENKDRSGANSGFSFLRIWMDTYHATPSRDNQTPKRAARRPRVGQ